MAKPKTQTPPKPASKTDVPPKTKPADKGTATDAEADDDAEDDDAEEGDADDEDDEDEDLAKPVEPE